MGVDISPGRYERTSAKPPLPPPASWADPDSSALGLLRGPSWWLRAACRDADAIRKGGEAATAAARKALEQHFTSDDPWYPSKAIERCNTCPVADHCLNFALANNERVGLWAVSGHERKAILRRHGVLTVAQAGGYLRAYRGWQG